MDQANVAVITGAGRGIGRATAVELAKAGYRLVLAARDASGLNETAGLAGEGALVVPTDVTKRHDVDRLISTTLEKLGRIDALINNAGHAPLAPVAETTDDTWRAVIDTNLSAAFYATRAAWPAFARQKGGVIVNISSVAARDPFAGFGAYGPAKAALNLFGTICAKEGAAINLRVHTVAPGATETGMFRSLMTEEQWPAENALDPSDVARVVVQCVRGDLTYTSGEVIYLHKTV